MRRLTESFNPHREFVAAVLPVLDDAGPDKLMEPLGKEVGGDPGQPIGQLALAAGTAGNSLTISRDHLWHTTSRSRARAQYWR